MRGRKKRRRRRESLTLSCEKLLRPPSKTVPLIIRERTLGNLKYGDRVKEMDGRPERKKSRVSHNPRHNERDRNRKRQDKRHTEPSGRCHMSGLEGSSARETSGDGGRAPADHGNLAA